MLLAAKALLPAPHRSHISGTGICPGPEIDMNLSSMRAAPVVRSALKVIAVSALAGLGLSGCYVVPMQPGATAPQLSAQYQAVGVMPAPPAVLTAPAIQTFAARLYPSNAEAARIGMVGAVVTNDMNSRGHFSTVMNGEQFQGEATRVPGSRREGVANASGSRGGILSCRYTMNSDTLGAGVCTLNNGATFTMHVGG